MKDRRGEERLGSDKKGRESAKVGLMVVKKGKKAPDV